MSYLFLSSICSQLKKLTPKSSVAMGQEKSGSKDCLTRAVAEEERVRIARDLHDGIMQPYIGLQMAISAIKQKVAAGNGDILRDVEVLEQICDESARELRCYINELKYGQANAEPLLQGLHRFITKYQEMSGIEVRLEINPQFSVPQVLSSQIFHIIAEALSNVRRHTRAKSVLVHLDCTKEQVFVCIENSSSAKDWKPHFHSGENGTRASFTPLSIFERAQALGGTAWAETWPDGGALVSVAIPLIAKT